MIWMKILGALSIVWIINAEATSSSHYTAGVVEFRPNLSGLTSSEMLADHLRAYDAIIRSSEANQTDIIVFPEGTLNNDLQLSYVPSPRDDVIPCLENKNFADFLVKLSCTARDVRKYLVINLSEKEECSVVSDDPRPCAANGLNIYNTNVVFDREGRVISRYRKVHVYVENKNTTHEPEFGVFETDFGVRFGHFICFDILFYTPAQELVDRYGIRNFILTSFFYSELPFLTATQLQQSWAWGNNVNLLAAGASYPERGVTGTGIYAGERGHLVSAMVGGAGIRKLFVSRVPIAEEDTQFERNPRLPQTGIRLMKDPQLRAYNSELLDLSSGSAEVSRKLCHNNFCCHFRLIASKIGTRHHKHRIGVFDGRRTYEKEEWSDIKVCALYVCTTDDVESCGEALEDGTNIEAKTIFESLEIVGAFEKIEKMLIMPNSLNFQLYSLNSDAVSFERQDNGTHFLASFELLMPQEEFLTFGIYAQYFEGSRAGTAPKPNLIMLQIFVGLAFVQLATRKWTPI